MSGKETAFNRKSMLALSIALLALTALLVAGCGKPSENVLAINEVKLQESDLPGWSLIEEVKATPENAAPKSIVKQLYDAGAVTILNQVFEKEGVKLQVNYVQMEDAAAGRKAEEMLKTAVGSTNHIGHKNNIAIELIGSVADMGLAAQKLKLSL